MLSGNGRPYASTITILKDTKYINVGDVGHVDQSIGEVAEDNIW